MNDEKLIYAIKARDESAIGYIIEKYSKLLWRIAGRVLDGIGSSQDIEECVADAFVNLWFHPEKYDPVRSGLKTYLSVIARTNALNRAREIAKRSIFPLDEAVLTNGLDISDALISEETKTALRKAIGELDEIDREILLRRYYYSEKPKTIALALSVSVKQVDNRLYQTKRKLLKTLSE